MTPCDLWTRCSDTGLLLWSSLIKQPPKFHTYTSHDDTMTLLLILILLMAAFTVVPKDLKVEAAVAALFTRLAQRLVADLNGKKTASPWYKCWLEDSKS